ncbi:hypothetical protein Tco_1408870 [Tanacetum coccineum]
MEATRRGKQTEFQKGFQKQARAQVRPKKPDRFSLLTKTTKEIFALGKGKFKAPPPMLKKQIDEMIKEGKLSQFIKELKQNDNPKAPKKGETNPEKERPLAILMVQPWEKVAKQKVTQSFSPETTISFPPLGDEDGTEGPMIIEAEIEGTSCSKYTLDADRKQHQEQPLEAGKILEEKIRVAIHPEYPEQTIAIGSTLTSFECFCYVAVNFFFRAVFYDQVIDIYLQVAPGKHPSRIFRRCFAACRGTPVLSAGFQAKTSKFCPKIIAHSIGMILLLRNVTVPPSTGNINIPCAVDGMAQIFLIFGLPIISLCWDGDLTTMKFIHAEVEFSSSPIFTSKDIWPIGQMIIGPSVPSSSPRGGKEIVVSGEKL